MDSTENRTQSPETDEADRLVDDFIAFYVPAQFNDKALRRRIAGALSRARAEGIEAAARWHDEQATGQRNIAANIRKDWTGQDIGEADRRDNLRYAREHDVEAGHHDRHAKAIRALIDEPPAAASRAESNRSGQPT